VDHSGYRCRKSHEVITENSAGAIMSEVEKTSEYYKYIFQAWKAPKATDDTRVALVAHQLGLSEQDLEPFYYVRRKGASKRYFHYEKFAETYRISIDWLHHGYLPAHPRHLKPIKKPRRAKRAQP
jgi:hypothetical protein